MADPFQSLIPKKEEEPVAARLPAEGNPFAELIPDFTGKKARPKNIPEPGFDMGDLIDLGKSLAKKSLAFNKGAAQGFREVSQEAAKILAKPLSDEFQRQVSDRIAVQRKEFKKGIEGAEGFGEAGRVVGSLGTQIGLTAPLGGIGAAAKGILGVGTRLGAGAAAGGLIGALTPSEGDDLAEKAGLGAVVGAGAQAAIEAAIPAARPVKKGLTALKSLLGSKKTISKEILKEAKQGADTMKRIRSARQLDNPLTPAEASERFVLLEQQGKLGITKDVQRKVDDFFVSRDLKSAKNIDDLKELIHEGPVGDDIARAAHQFADDALKVERSELIAKARPLYEAAEKVKVPPAVSAKLQKDPIIAEVIEKVEKTPVLKKQFDSFAPDSLGRFDIIKRTIDDQVSTALRQGEANKARVLGDSVDQIRDAMDSLSPQYKQARKIFEQGSREIKLLDDSPMGVIANLKDKQFKTLTNKLFDPAETNREVLSSIRDRFLAEKPELWYALTRKHIETKLRSASDASIGKGLVGKHFQKTILGSPAKRDVLFTALEKHPQARQRLIHVARTFDSMGKPPITGSPEFLRAVESESTLSLPKQAGIFLGRVVKGRYDAAVADMVLDPKWGAQLDKIIKEGGSSIVKQRKTADLIQKYITATGTEIGVE